MVEQRNHNPWVVGSSPSFATNYFVAKIKIHYMSVLSDTQIKKLSLEQCMISPFEGNSVSRIGDKKIISYGLSSYGYDARLANEFKIFTDVHSSVIDPKDFKDENFVHKEGDVCIIPPNGFVLGRTIEAFKIPRDCIVICLGKSTYARCGLVVNVTPLEPEWEGHVTLEFSNTTPLPIKIYANEGICQFLFLRSDGECDYSYLDKAGKYHGQTGITLPKMK